MLYQIKSNCSWLVFIIHVLCLLPYIFSFLFFPFFSLTSFLFNFFDCDLISWEQKWVEPLHSTQQIGLCLISRGLRQLADGNYVLILVILLVVYVWLVGLFISFSSYFFTRTWCGVGHDCLLLDSLLFLYSFSHNLDWECLSWKVGVYHAFNSSTRKAEAGSMRPVRFRKQIVGQSGLHREALSQKHRIPSFKQSICMHGCNPRIWDLKELYIEDHPKPEL